MQIGGELVRIGQKNQCLGNLSFGPGGVQNSILNQAPRLQAAPLFSFACWLANKCCGGKLRTWFVIVLIAGNDAARIHQMMEGMGKEGQLAGSSEQD